MLREPPTVEPGRRCLVGNATRRSIGQTAQSNGGGGANAAVGGNPSEIPPKPEAMDRARIEDARKNVRRLHRPQDWSASLGGFEQTSRIGNREVWNWRSTALKKSSGNLARSSFVIETTLDKRWRLEPNGSRLRFLGNLGMVAFFSARLPIQFRRDIVNRHFDFH